MPATSEARIRANRDNAKKSTGPRTAEGKDRSRANALTHGLTAKILRTAEEFEALGDPTPPPSGRPGTACLTREWIVKEIQLLAMRVGRAGLIELKLRERSALRAHVSWDDDRRHDAEILSSKIRKKPAEIASKLESTPQGCLLKIERWAMLARYADLHQQWSPVANELAFDLQGTPLELRDGPAHLFYNVDGEVIEPDCGPAEFARRNVDRLMQIRETLQDSDTHDQATAKAGLAPDLGTQGRNVARYEAELQRRLKWYHQLLDRIDQDDATPPETVEGPEAGPEPEPKTRETSEAASQPRRRDRKLLRAERRRLAAERKLARRLE